MRYKPSRTFFDARRQVQALSRATTRPPVFVAPHLTLALRRFVLHKAEGTDAPAEFRLSQAPVRDASGRRLDDASRRRGLQARCCRAATWTTQPGVRDSAPGLGRRNAAGARPPSRAFGPPAKLTIKRLVGKIAGRLV